MPELIKKNQNQGTIRNGFESRMEKKTYSVYP